MTDIKRKLEQAALPDPYDEREVLHAPLMKKAAEKISKLEAELHKAYSILEIYGVPKERARSVNNGIEVLSTRFRKEIAMLEAQIKDCARRLMLETKECSNLIEENQKLRDALQNIADDPWVGEEPIRYKRGVELIIGVAKQALEVSDG